MAGTVARRSARYLPSHKGGDKHEIEDQCYRWIGAGSCNHGNGTGACQRWRLYRAELKRGQFGTTAAAEAADPDLPGGGRIPVRLPNRAYFS
jgi:hypothetical protein